ncbi:MAG: pantoate--beta-alanine ligase [Gammaproteobacteria bacterium]|nr:pantoate--beta-alanine ligase [Gammaproteobacteria bacterium]
MITCQTIDAIRQQVADWKTAGDTIAFVPTMGNLHAGHLQLVSQARQQASRVVVSIFVNPLQFNEAADFEHYPRTIDEDCRQLQSAAVDALFLPTLDVIYPHGQSATTKVIVPGLGDILEGEHRPGHFTGVTTVVNKLFNMVQPDLAFFGEKDYQQLMLIRRMRDDLDMPVQVRGVATQREPDGLAMSSRNGRLDAGERQLAPCLYQQLAEIEGAIARGEEDFRQLEQDAEAHLDRQGFRTEYVRICRQQDLSAAQPGDDKLVILLAAWLGQTRLIDNISFSSPSA